MDIDKLIDLGKISPEYANTVQEFERLRELTTDRTAKQHLTDMVSGCLRIVDNPESELDSRLIPVGPADSTHISTVTIMGAPTSVWECNSWMARMKFLLTGRIAVVYPDESMIVPLDLRLDVEEMGITVTK